MIEVRAQRQKSTKLHAIKEMRIRADFQSWLLKRCIAINISRLAQVLNDSSIREGLNVLKAYYLHCWIISVCISTNCAHFFFIATHNITPFGTYGAPG